ncbi:SRPBCC family protein [Dermatophilaceae bacterium Soc4.6]
MELTHTETVRVAASPEQVYALVTDIARTGEWSPICQSCWWDEGALVDGAPRVGSGFTGRNVTPDRTWETHSTVIAADPGKAFAWEVGEGLVSWAYTMAPVEDASELTELTESWAFLPAGLELFRTRFGERAEHEITVRAEAAHAGIPVTLAAIRAVAERETA